MNEECERDIVRVIYNVFLVFGGLAFGISLMCLVGAGSQWPFVSAFLLGVLLVSAGGIGLTLLEIRDSLRPKKETLEEAKQRRWKEYEESIQPPRES